MGREREQEMLGRNQLSEQDMGLVALSLHSECRAYASSR